MPAIYVHSAMCSLHVLFCMVSHFSFFHFRIPLCLTQIWKESLMCPCWNDLAPRSPAHKLPKPNLPTLLVLCSKSWCDFWSTPYSGTTSHRVLWSRGILPASLCGTCSKVYWRHDMRQDLFFVNLVRDINTLALFVKSYTGYQSARESSSRLLRWLTNASTTWHLATYRNLLSHISRGGHSEPVTNFFLSRSPLRWYAMGGGVSQMLPQSFGIVYLSGLDQRPQVLSFSDLWKHTCSEGHTKADQPLRHFHSRLLSAPWSLLLVRRYTNTCFIIIYCYYYYQDTRERAHDARTIAGVLMPWRVIRQLYFW